MKIRRAPKSAEEWSDIYKSRESSALSIEDFCKQEGVCLTSYYKNRKKFELNNEVKFLKVDVGKNEPPPRKLLLELKFNNWELIFLVGSR